MEQKRGGRDMSAMEAGTLLSVDGTVATRKPARAHPASRTKLQHAAETADGPGLASRATGLRVRGPGVSVSVFYGATAEVDIASGREAGRGGTCSSVHMHLQCVPSFRW